ncbi:MAG: hypothetical protein ACI30M_02615 [Muribaculaceae bacterium]
MLFIKYNVPKNNLRNGYSYNNTAISAYGVENTTTSTIVETSPIINYLPSYYNITTGKYDVVDKVNFSNIDGNWTFQKRTITSDENGSETIEETPILTITPDGIEVNGSIKASKSITSQSEIMAHQVNLMGGNNKVLEALENVESATSIDDIKTILINLRNSLI